MVVTAYIGIGANLGDARGGGASAQAGLTGQPSGYFPSGAVAEAMQDMAQLERLVGRLSGSPAATGTNWRGPGAAPVAYVVPYAPPVDGQAYSPAVAVEVVGRMMDNIAQDGRLLAPVQRAVQNLEPAIKQLVQHDGRFFTDETHPARRLLDELTQRSLAFNTESAQGFSQFMRLLNQAVEHLAATDIQDAGPFDTVLKALHAAWDTQAQKIKSQQEAKEKILLQAEQREMLAEKIAADIRKLPDLEQVPQDILDFVTGPWADVVALAAAACCQAPWGWRTSAVSGARSSRPLMTLRARSTERASISSARAYNAITMAASGHWPMTNAPVTATVISALMLSRPRPSAATPLR